MKWNGQLAMLGAALVLAGPGLPSPGGEPNDRAWVEQRVSAWEPAGHERVFHDIGWAGSLIDAGRLARQHGRGIFLFTYDGASLAGYRC